MNCNPSGVTVKPSTLCSSGPTYPPGPGSDAEIIEILCDLFAGRSHLAFGEGLDWWAETLQCDLPPEAALGVALVALSKWPFDQRTSATGVKALQDELLKRARMLIERSLRDTGEVVL